MAIDKKGADPVALRSAADRLGSHVRDCHGIRGEASRAVHALKGQWSGADLERLLSTWRSVDVQLLRLGDDLTALSAAVRRNTAEQDTTSNASAGGPGQPVAPVVDNPTQRVGS